MTISRRERADRLPGDELVVCPVLVTDHAITIEAPPAQVWPWLVQMGWRRGAWYTPRWVDRLLFPANGPSADRVVAEWQDLSVGDWVPDGPPESGCGFTVARLFSGRHIVLRSNTHLPPSWRDRFGAWIDWSWAFVLHDAGATRTRLQVRSRSRLGPRWLVVLYRIVLVPADALMSHQMLRGVKRRAERASQEVFS
jgi:hypothetical protein